MITLSKRHLALEGSKKKLYESNQPDLFIMQFKDQEKSLIELSEQAHVEGSGTVNNAISAFIMGKMRDLNIPTHFIRQINMREQAVYGMEMFPFTLTLRNYANGDTMKRLGVVEQSKLPYPLLEYHMSLLNQKDAKKTELITPMHLMALGWLHEVEVEEIERMALRMNDFLTGLFSGGRLTLVSYNLQFGRFVNSETEDFQIMIGDEITPRTCELWDSTHVEGQKHRYLSEIEVAHRLGLLPQHTQDLPPLKTSPAKKTPKRNRKRG